MNAAQKLHLLGQSIWLDNITRDLLKRGILARYIDEFAVTGLTSNPTIFYHAIRDGSSYDAAIREKALQGMSAEELFLALAIEDVSEAATHFLPAYSMSNGRDGWVSIEVSPLLADDVEATVRAAKVIHEKADCPNLLVKIPGNAAGLAAAEECLFSGIPVNFTLLFSREQYLAAVETYMRALERRMAAGLDLEVNSVASVFVSRWDVAIHDRVQQSLRNRLGIAISKRIYAAYLDLHNTPRWKKIATSGGKQQRLLWASTGTKDPEASEALYVEALEAPDTINTMPDKTLLAFARHGAVREPLRLDWHDADQILESFRKAGINEQDLAGQLQREGRKSFETSYLNLIECIKSKLYGS